MSDSDENIIFTFMSLLNLISLKEFLYSIPSIGFTFGDTQITSCSFFIAFEALSNLAKLSSSLR